MDTETDMDRPLPGRRYYVAMWHMHGFEALVDVGDMWQKEQLAEQQYIYDVLADASPSRKKPFRQEIGNLVNRMQIRAQVNSHRNYEIYMFMTDDDVEKSTLESMMDEDPQSLVDMIRSHGVHIYGHKLQDDTPVIR